MKRLENSIIIFVVTILTTVLLFQASFKSVTAQEADNISLTLAGTEDVTSADVIAYNANVVVLDVISVIDSSINNPVYEVNVPKYIKINKFTIPADSNGKLQKVEIIDKENGTVLSVDNCTKDRILKFTITPGTIGPTGFVVEVSAYGYYVLPTETFTLYAEYFNAVNKLYKSNDFKINAENLIYKVVIDAGRGDLDQGKLGRYSIRIESNGGGSYNSSPYMPDAVVKIPLPEGVEFVRGDSGVQYVPVNGNQPHYLLINAWNTQIGYKQWKKFDIYYPAAKVGEKYTGEPVTLTYTHGGRVETVFTQQNGIYNKIKHGAGFYTDHRAKSYKYKIGANGSPFLVLNLSNNLGQDLTNVNYDITLPEQLRIKGFKTYNTRLNNIVYATITFTTNNGNIITKKVDRSSLNITPSVLGLSEGEWITKVNIKMSTVPRGFMLYQVPDSGADNYYGFVLYGTTADNVADQTTATIKIEECNDQETDQKTTKSYPMLLKDVSAPVCVSSLSEIKTVVAGQKVTLSERIRLNGYPYSGDAYNTIVNPTLYFIIPSGFTVKTNEVILAEKFINKKPNITWNPSTILPNPLDTNFPNGAGLLKIEFDGLTPEKSATIRGLDENCNYLNEGGTVQFPVQALENTKIGSYNFKPFILMEAQNTKVGRGWGVGNWKDIYDTNGNGDKNENIAYSNLDAINYPNYYVIVTDPLSVSIKPSISSRLSGEDTTVKLFPNDSAEYSVEINNRLNKVTTNVAVYVPIPQKNDNVTDSDEQNFTQGWTAQLENMSYIQTSESGDEAQGVEMWYSTSSNPTKNELTGGTDEEGIYTKYTGGSLPSNIKMVKLKVAQIPKNTLMKFILDVKASYVPEANEVSSYIISDYIFTYNEIDTVFKTSGKTMIYKPYKVLGKVFEDINLNGAHDIGEPLLKDLKICLLDETGTVTQEVYSTSDGIYEFVINDQGSYKIDAFNNDEGICFTDPNSSTQGSKVDENGEYSFTIDQSTTDALEGIHIGYVISWRFEASENPIIVAHSNFKYVQLTKLPFKALLRSGELVYTDDPEISTVEWDESTQDPFDLRVACGQTGVTNLVIQFQSGSEGVKEERIPIVVTNRPPEVPTNVLTVCNDPRTINLTAKAIDEDVPQKVKIQWQYRKVGDIEWIEAGESCWGESESDIIYIADFQTPGVYEIRCRAIDECDVHSDWTTPITLNVWFPAIGEFTDRVTGRNNWIENEEEKKNNWYSAKMGDEVMTRITINDDTGVGYDSIILDYDLNSSNNGEVDIKSPQVAAIMDADQSYSNFTTILTSNDTSMKLTINNPQKNKEIKIYVKYKVKMKYPTQSLNNKELINKVKISIKKNSKEYSIKDVNISDRININDIQIKIM